MDEQMMQDRLHEILEVVSYSDSEELEDFGLSEEMQAEEVATFEAEGVLTMNKGLVVKMQDGTEFQITIVQSR